MSRRSSQERYVTIGDTEIFTVVREELQTSPGISSVNLSLVDGKAEKNEPRICNKICKCNRIEHSPLSGLQLEEEYARKNEQEAVTLRETFNFILQNEQVRSSYMMREAYRERQEKIKALQTQLECRNLAALMFVLSTERRRSQLEKLRIIEQFTNHINELLAVLREAQALILNLSRGYKTAARVDQDWKEKMKKVLEEFQNFVVCFGGGEAVYNQYFFDIPELIKTTARLSIDPDMDPCEEPDEVEGEEGPSVEEEEEPTPGWFDRMDEDCHPFVTYGDMGEFLPTRRRNVLKAVRNARVRAAPQKWKEYVFNEKTLHAKCNHTDAIKDDYPPRPPQPPGGGWECSAARPRESVPGNYEMGERRDTTTSFDNISGEWKDPGKRATIAMGSIIKMIASAGSNTTVTNKSLLAAKDSMEIVSSTKLLKKQKKSGAKVILKTEDATEDAAKDTRTEEVSKDISSEEETTTYVGEEQAAEKSKETPTEPSKADKQENIIKTVEEDEEEPDIHSLSFKDSLEVNLKHVPDKDGRIQFDFEKLCPTEKCQRLHVDSFVRSLPAYMHASPYTHFEHTFENYEVCSPEQLKLLMERIDSKKNREKHDMEKAEDDPLAEWTTSDGGGVAVQTSAVNFAEESPECTCKAAASMASSDTHPVFDLKDIQQAKQLIDHINLTCIHNSRIETDRFNIVGQDNADEEIPFQKRTPDKFYEIKKVLRKHPSLCDLFISSAR